jgi:amino acid adenylation domain-containing protein
MSVKAAVAPTDHGGELDWPFEPMPPSALQGSASDRFDAVARRFSSRLALDDGARAFSYSELAGLVDDIAAATADATAGRPGPVAVLFHHEARFPAAILGVLAAGRACVPLDADYPIARNRMIAGHAAAVAVVSVGTLAAEACGLFPDLPVLDIEALPPRQEGKPHRRPRPDDVAYIIYTSGSTGTPKGVYQNHRGVVRDIMQCVDVQHLSCDDRVALFYSPTVASGFRIAVSALLVGASLHILPPRDLGPAGLAQAIRERGITIFRAVAALFRHVVEPLADGERLDSLRLVVLGGDRVDWSDFDLFKRGCASHARFGVHLGATEVSLYLEWYVDERIRPSSPLLPVGRPVSDRTTLLLGEDGQPVRDGEIGEFAVSSRYIALGYWPPSELTAPFSIDPADAQARLYWTGDLGRRRPDGLFEHVGRKDQQIKLHGYRIEPAEIEAALKDCAGVRDAALVVRRDETGVPISLVGYVEPRPGTSSPVPRAVLAALAQRVPRHMVPAALRVLDPLPRLPSLKIDRVGLAEIDAERSVQTRQHGSTRTDSASWSDATLAMRRTLVEALRHATGRLNKPALALQLDDPDIDVPIADLGIDSLHFIGWCMEIQARTGVEIRSEDLAATTSLDEMVGLIVDRRSGAGAVRDEPPLPRAPRDRPPPLSFAQERVWTEHQAQPSIFAVALSDDIVGPLDVEVLRECLSAIVKRHEILRTTIEIVDGQPAQIVHPATPVAMSVIYLAPWVDPEVEIARILKEEMRKVSNLARGPLARFTLVRLNDNEHRLLRVCHHILWDAGSTEVLLSELAARYQARLDGVEAPLAPEPIQYGDYAAWQRETFRPGSPAYREAIAWWQGRFPASWTPSDLPFKRPVPVTGLHPGDGRMTFPIDPLLGLRLDRLRRAEATTVYMIWLAAFGAVMAQETGQSGVVVGTYVTRRRRADLRSVIGDFTSLATLGLRCDLDASFHDLLTEACRCVTQAEQHGEISPEELRKEIPHLPHIEAIFGAPLDYAHTTREFANISMSRRHVPRNPIMPWGFSMNVFGTSDRQECHVSFNAHLHDPAAVRRFVDRLFGLLDAVSRGPNVPLREALGASGLQTEK